MKKLVILSLSVFCFTTFTLLGQTDTTSKSFDIAPEIIEKLDGEQLLELAKEKEKLKQEHETAMAEKFGVNGQEMINDLMPSEFTIVLSTIFFFVFLVSLFIIPFYFNQRKSKMRFNLLSKLVDKDKEIPHELLIQSKKNRSDLHKSIILISIGSGVCLFLFLLKLEKSYWTIGLIPTIIGLGYLISSVLEKKNKINS